MNGSLLAYIVSLILFGSNGVAASLIHLPSTQIVVLRSVLGTALLAVIFFSRRRRLSLIREHPREALFACLSGAAAGVSWLFLYEAYRQVGVAISTLIYYFGPVLVIALSVLFFHERLSRTRGAALVMAVAGVFLITGQEASDGAGAWGLVCAALAAAAYAAMILLGQAVRHTEGMESVLLQLGAAACTTAVFAALHGDLVAIPASADWPAVLWLGLVNTGLGCFLYFSSVGKLSVQTVAVCGYLEPLSAVLFSAAFLHEKLLPVQLLGAALILGGALFGEGIARIHSKARVPS